MCSPVLPSRATHRTGAWHRRASQCPAGSRTAARGGSPVDYELTTRGRSRHGFAFCGGPDFASTSASFKTLRYVIVDAHKLHCI
jgi:hypothetical protein